MKNVAILCTKLNEGGAERFAVNLANALAKDEYMIYLLTGPKCSTEYSIDEKVNRISLISLNKNLFFDAVRTRGFCINKDIDVLIAVNIYPNLVSCLANFNLKTKIVISERNAPGYLKVSWKTSLLKKLLYGRADQYVFQTKGASDYYPDKIRQKSVIIQNPVKDGLPEKTTIDNREIVAIGRLAEQKNYACLIRAFSLVVEKYPDYRLVIYGDGKLKNNLTALCAQCGIENKVIFYGFCFDVHERIRDSQIYVLSSDFEGMPNSLMEAMAMGFPVVSTDCPTGGPRELIEDGINGLLVNVNDYKQLASRILFLIENPKIRREIGCNAEKIKMSNSEKYIISVWKDKIIR